MLEYQGGPGFHVGKAKEAIFQVGMAIPEGPHRDRMFAFMNHDGFTAVTEGTEAVYAALMAEDITYTQEQEGHLIDALLHLSRAAIAWAAGGKEGRWIELQTWAWKIKNGEEPSEDPAVDPALLPTPDPEPVSPIIHTEAPTED